MELKEQKLWGKNNMAKKLSCSQKYSQLKRHTENAGMTVKEKDGKIIVKRKVKNVKKNKK